MKQIINYLNRNGYDYKVIDFNRDYFTNVPAVITKHININIDYSNDPVHAVKLYDKLMSYIKRYDYRLVYSKAAHGTTFLTIATAHEYNKAIDYRGHQQRAVDEIERLYHSMYKWACNHPKQSNHRVNQVMRCYGNMYLKGIKAGYITH